MTSWRAARLVAFDLEGSGAQDRDDEAILEIAAVPLAGGVPDVGVAYCSLVNPLVGHNIAVDWRLLHRRCPTIEPAGLLDTLRLAKNHRPNGSSRALSAVVEQLDLTAETNRLAAGSQPHRALWDATATGLLLQALVAARYDSDPTLTELLQIAHRPLTAPEPDALRLF